VIKSRRRSMILIVITLLLLCLLSACNTQRRPDTTAPNTPNENQNTQMPQNQAGDQDMATGQKIAERVTKDVNVVKSATVIVTGNQAWIGVDVGGNVEVDDRLKESISNVAKEVEPNIQTVYVTADADLVTRLRNIANDIAAGKPVSGFLNELMEIAGRISPKPN